MADIESRVNSVEHKVTQLDGRVTKCEYQITDIRSDCSKDMSNLRTNLEEKIRSMSKNSDTVLILVKWVITPLIIIIAGLAGINLAFPGIGG